MEQQKKFGTFTTIAMIVGIVVGSGIFFKTPQIVSQVGGNILFGIIVFLIASVGIIFGGLTISLYAKNESSVGGIITYCEMAWGKSFGYLAGWFQMIFYFPALIAVVAWVAANYTCAFLDLPNLLIGGQLGKEVWIFTCLYLVGIYTLNCFKTMWAGKFQNIATIVKIVALAILAIVGLVKGNVVDTVQSTLHYPISHSGFLGALIIVAFAFDGWMVAPSIAHEIKNPKRNLPFALTIAPIVITLLYIAYFVGICSLATPNVILQGIDPLQIVATKLFGRAGMKIVLLLIIISVLGTLNGIILSYIRLPYALGLRGQIKKSHIFSKINKNYDIPFASLILCACLTLFWALLHFLSVDGPSFDFTLLEGLAVDNLPIVLTYVFYALLYLAVIFKGIEGQKLSFINRYVVPTFALAGACLVIYGGAIQPQFNTYFLIGIIGILAGWMLKPTKSNK